MEALNNERGSGHSARPLYFTSNFHFSCGAEMKILFQLDPPSLRQATVASS
jgi:hypothetical protein